LFPLGVVLMTVAVFCLGGGFSIDPTYPLPDDAGAGEEVAANIHLLFVKQYLILTGAGTLISGSIFLAAAEVITTLRRVSGLTPANAGPLSTESLASSDGNRDVVGIGDSKDDTSSSADRNRNAPEPNAAKLAAEKISGTKIPQAAKAAWLQERSGIQVTGTPEPELVASPRKKAPPVFTEIVCYRDRYIRYAKTGEAQYNDKDFATLDEAKAYIDQIRGADI